MTYLILSGSKPLSGFYPNAITGVFAFRTRDWMTFDTETGAKKFIEYVLRKTKNTNRWGEKKTKKYQSIAKNLKYVFYTKNEMSM